MSVASAHEPFLEYTTVVQNAVPSGTQAIVFSKILPAGKWLIAGSVQANGDTGNLTTVETSTSVRTLSKSISATGPTSVRVPVSTLYISDGETAFTLRLQCYTSTGTWSAPAGLIVDCYKLL
jgi:uncharacterized repeat protein (TIGR01451 family)